MIEADSLGHHYFFEFYDCSADKLSQVNAVRSAMLEAAIRSGATIVKDVFHQFNPHGVSGVVVIEESHLSIHTWPEYGYAAVDFFTCSSHTDPKKAMEYLSTTFCSKKSDFKFFKRGSILKQADIQA